MKLPLLPLLAVLACVGASVAAENVPPTTDGKTVIPPPIEATPKDANPADAAHPVRPWRPEDPVAGQPGVVRTPATSGPGTVVVPGTGTGAGTVVIPGAGTIPQTSTTPGSRAPGDMSAGTVIGSDPTRDANTKPLKPADGPAMKPVDDQNGMRPSDTGKTGIDKKDGDKSTADGLNGTLNNSQQDAKDQNKNQQNDQTKDRMQDQKKDLKKDQTKDQMKDSKSDSSKAKDSSSAIPSNANTGSQTPEKSGNQAKPGTTGTGAGTGTTR